jgi:hypothetical protein
MQAATSASQGSPTPPAFIMQETAAVCSTDQEPTRADVQGAVNDKYARDVRAPCHPILPCSLQSKGYSMAQESTVCVNVEPDGCSSVATPVPPAPARIRVGKGDADGTKASRSMTCKFSFHRYGSHPGSGLPGAAGEKQLPLMILHC